MQAYRAIIIIEDGAQPPVGIWPPPQPAHPIQQPPTGGSGQPPGGIWPAPHPGHPIQQPPGGQPPAAGSPEHPWVPPSSVPPGIWPPPAPQHPWEPPTQVPPDGIAPGLPSVLGDARRLRQVLQNLVENAVKYSPDGGCVAVQLSARDTMIEVRVEDEGLGIPPDQLALIFERFHRVDNSKTRSIGGTGLGLAIVKGLVEAHGGAIHAESAGEGRGSTFVVTLPGMRE